MSIPDFLENEILEIFGCKAEQISPVGGGCINETSRVTLSDGQSLFLKQNRIDLFDMFEKEALGLQILKEAAVDIVIPEIHAILKDEQTGLAALLLSYIEENRAQTRFHEQFGQALARLHQHSESRFGLDHDNYIGRLPQKNEWRDHWPDFFIECRLVPQMEIARNSGFFSGPVQRSFEHLCSHLPGLFPVEPPALLHGDLWSGNYLCDTEQRPVLIDPAVYYGHRESELAFTQLFGAFDPGFYDGYNEVYPLEPGFAERKDIYNLYHLLVHVNLFGGSYAAQAETVLRRF